MTVSRIFILAMLSLVAGASCLSATAVRSYRIDSSRSVGNMMLSVDSIDFRPDLTRVYGKLTGIPHTSNRIDRLSLKLVDGSVVESTDIDGIDMKRWFQWEDDGRIPVEIDFGVMKSSPEVLIIDVDAAKGKCSWRIVNEKKKP